MARDGDGIYIRNGHYWISYKDAEGRRRRRKIIARNRTEASELRAGFVNREQIAEAHGIRPPGLETFAEVAGQYLQHQRRRLTPAAFERERGIVVNHLAQFFAGPLSAIRRAHVHRYITERVGVSNATLAKELTTLKHLFRLAVEEWEIIPANPAHGIKPPKPAPGRVRYLQPGELAILLAAAPTWLRPIVALAAATGMRRAEMLRLRWLDIDLTGARILLPQTKNNEGRIVYLNQLAMKAIRSLSPGRGADTVFPADLDPRWVSVAFVRVCRQLGIRDFHFHDLRHTAASWMRMAGADIHTVAQLLGHKDLRMAARYQHLAPAFLAEAVGRLDQTFELCHPYVTAPRSLPALSPASV